MKIRLDKIERDLAPTEPEFAWARAKWRNHRDECRLGCADGKRCDVGERLLRDLCDRLARLAI